MADKIWWRRRNAEATQPDATLNPASGTHTSSVGFYKLLTQKRLIRNVATVASGTAFAQIINLAFAPILTRVYGPEPFGILGAFVAVVAIATPAAALCYPIAIVLPNNGNDAKQIARLAAYIAFATAGAVTALLLLGHDWLTEMEAFRGIEDFLLFVPLAMLFSSFKQIGQQWLTRTKTFSVIARVAALQAVVVNSLKSVFGLFLPAPLVLIALSTLADLLYGAMLAFGIAKSRKDRQADQENEPRTRLMDIARTYAMFPLYRAPQALLNAISQGLPALVLAANFSPSVVGFYAIARSVLAVPAALVGSAVGNVLYPRFTEAKRKGESLSPLLIKTTAALAALGLAPFGLVALFGPQLFGFVFGGEWKTSGIYAQWLSLWLYFGFMNVACHAALPVLSLLRAFLIYEIASVLLRITTLIVGIYIYKSELISIALLSAIGALLNLSLIVGTIAFSVWKDKTSAETPK